MEILLGKTAGFCYGVSHAIQKTEELLETSRIMYCLGDLVHNEQVIANLKNKGLRIIEKIEQAPDFSTVIIRAHGVPKQIYQQAEERNIQLVDLTCVKVLNIHKQAIDYADKGYYIFLIAEKDHPETIGTISYCGINSCIIQKIEDTPQAIDNFEQSKKKKLVILSQTTFSLEMFDKITNEIISHIKKDVQIDIKKTICNATNLRQKETKELSQTVDFMIVIGGLKSSNTQKLYEIAKENCNHAILIQTKENLPIEEIKRYPKIGIMAGASTPKQSIEEVIQSIEGDKV